MRLSNTFRYKIQITYINGSSNYFHEGDVYEADEFINVCQSIGTDVAVDMSIFAEDEYEMLIRDGQVEDRVYFKIFMPFDKGFAHDIEDSINR
jgi:hypothetical protein